jgi:hypothetical protein
MNCLAKWHFVDGCVYGLRARVFDLTKFFSEYAEKVALFKLSLRVS